MTKYFLKTRTTKWKDYIDDVVRIYNNEKHTSIDNIKPNEAHLEKHKIIISNINAEKSLANNRTSDLEPGDKVRINILDKVIFKGTDPRWSDEVYIVENAKGYIVYLDNNKKYKRDDALKVPKDTISSEKNVIHAEKKIRKEINQQSKQ